MRILLALLVACAAFAAEKQELAISLNQLHIGIDQQTGDIVTLSYPSVGSFLRAEPDGAGLLDLAYPDPNFAPLRLGSRFSNAVLRQETGGVTIVWSRLGASRTRVSTPDGAVSANVTIRAAPDGRSVILRCHIQNRSSRPIPQILFPDLHGFRPLAGPDRTELRLARGVVQPFSEPVHPIESANFYAERGWHEYPPKSYYSLNALRWIDFGSLGGGISIFQKEWATTDPPTLYTQRTEADPMNLRIFWENRVTVAPGADWDSGEFWFTPHPGGWAKGIEVFRNYVRQMAPARALPEHVRKGLGFRTYWEIQPTETDPSKAIYRFSDIPRLASDAISHGLEELCSWSWALPSTIPIPLHTELGTREEFLSEVQKAKAMGVNVAGFVSLATLRNQYAKRYGVELSTSNWTFHPEFVPNFRPYYSKYWDGAWIDSDNQLWEKDVFVTLAQWIHYGFYSFGWDQFAPKLSAGKQPDLISLIERLRALARAKDPQSTFSGETITPTGLETDGQVLDYTWNWVDYVDASPITSVLKQPRLNCNVEDSPLVVKKAFLDNLYINVMPSKPDEPNGSAMIADRPALAAALVQAANLRKQFLSYFLDGTFLGSSMLSAPSSGFVRAYQLGNKLLIGALNDTGQTQNIGIRIDLSLWLPVQRYDVKYLDHSGHPVRSWQTEGARWSTVTDALQPLGIAFFEIDAH